MVVVCQKCRTRFQLDGARIPAQGVRVRCSRCKHAFFVAPPATQDDTIHGLARQAAATGRPARPKAGPHVDLPGPGETDPELSRAMEDAAAASDEPEDDWQFNIDPPPEGEGDVLVEFDDSTPPPAEITDSEPTESEVESFFELDGLRDPGPERHAGSPAAAKGSAATSAPAKPAPAKPAAAPAAKPAAKRSAVKPAKAGRSAPAPSLIEPEQEVTFEDLGNPESWDFGAGEPSKAEPPAAVRSKPAERRAPAPPVRAEAEARPPVRRERRRAIPARATALASGAAWLVALGLFVLGMHGALSPAPVRVEAEPAPVGPLELSGLRVRHIENLWAGPLVVIAGELRNPGTAEASSGEAPRLRVTDRRGEPLDGPPVWFGPALPEQQLRTDDPDTLAGDLARSARQLTERTYAPFERVAVQAILAELPPGAAGFRVEPATPPTPPARLAPPPPDAAGTDPASPATGEPAPGPPGEAAPAGP